MTREPKVYLPQQPAKEDISKIYLFFASYPNSDPSERVKTMKRLAAGRLGVPTRTNILTRNFKNTWRFMIRFFEFQRTQSSSVLFSRFKLRRNGSRDLQATLAALNGSRSAFKSRCESIAMPQMCIPCRFNHAKSCSDLVQRSAIPPG